MSAHEKACTGCGVVKSLDDFRRDKRTKNGRRSECRGCSSEGNRRYREENRGKIEEIRRRYHEENRDYQNAKSLNYRMNCKHTSELFLSKPKWTPWTPEEEAFLLANDGRTDYQKAIELGRTYGSTVNRLYRLRKAQAQ